MQGGCGGGQVELVARLTRKNPLLIRPDYVCSPFALSVA